MNNTVQSILKTATLHLAKHSNTARVDIEILLCFVLKKPLSWLYTWPEIALTKPQQSLFDKLLAKRLSGFPIAYLTGTRSFWSLDLQVTNHTLIPRPETEMLVEITLDFFKRPFSKLAHEREVRGDTERRTGVYTKSHEDSSTVSPKQFSSAVEFRKRSKDLRHVNILDAGTGSGAIALALAKERPDWQITATDICEKALQIAKENAKDLQLKNISFYLSDWFTHLPKKSYHAIISNPPYIAENDPHLQIGDLRFEPNIALVSPENGYQDLRKLIEQSSKYLIPGGLLLLEHGYNQREMIESMLYKNNYQNIQSYKDLQGFDRIIVGISGIPKKQ